MRHIAIIGSGPAGFYTAEACQKLIGEAVRIDIIDRMPVPFGLIRTGVAPDHQSIKAVARLNIMSTDSRKLGSPATVMPVLPLLPSLTRQGACCAVFCVAGFA